MKKSTIITLSVVGIAVVLLLLLLFALTVHTADTDTEPVRINLPQGCTYPDLCDTLEAHRVVVPGTPAAWLFGIEARMLKLDKQVKPGSYLVAGSMPTLNLARKLRNGQQDPVRLTIGRFRMPQDLNDYLNSTLMHNDFDITLDSFHLVRPDTYEVYWTISPDAFMQRMSKEYRVFFERRGATPDKDVVILASIVEEETNNNTEKPLIASVYLNRLQRGMPLQADPTVKYAVGDFSLRRILNRHLGTESPFNTYLHTGLPPAPICLPSAASVEAVLNAPATDYLYFCASDLMDGTHRFATTLTEHNRNAQKFHQALDRNLLIR